MTATDSDPNQTRDAVTAAEETVRTLRAEVDRLKTDLAAAKTAQAAFGVSARETVESAVAEAKRRGNGRTRSEQVAAGDAAATSTRAENADAAFSAQSASDGRAEAARRAARR